MAAERSRPGNPNVRKSKTVGPDYGEEGWRNPWNAENGVPIESYHGNEHDKTLYSMNAETVTGAGAPLHENTYDELWTKGK